MPTSKYGMRFAHIWYNTNDQWNMQVIHNSYDKSATYLWQTRCAPVADVTPVCDKELHEPKCHTDIVSQLFWFLFSTFRLGGCRNFLATCIRLPQIHLLRLFQRLCSKHFHSRGFLPTNSTFDVCRNPTQTIPQHGALSVYHWCCQGCYSKHLFSGVHCIQVE